jgi:nucleoprotein TPR
VELNEKTEEFAKYRRSKHSELSQVQASFDALTQAHTSAESSLKTLQSAHTAQSHQLTQTLGKVRDLTGQLAELETTYESEATGLKKLVTMMEEREARQKESVDAIEKDWAGVGERAERREAALMEEIEKEKRGKEDARKKVEQLESVLDRVGRGELLIPGHGPGTPSRTATPDPTIDGMMGLSPTVAMASKAQRAGKTFTEVYADYVRLQDDYAKKSAEYDHMDRTLSDVLAQIEERVRFNRMHMLLWC